MINRIKYHFKNLASIFLGRHIFIYQMGKVGSSSIEKSLEQKQIPCRHIHTLYGETSNYNFTQDDKARKLKNWLLNFPYRLSFKYGRKVKIITLMRDPVARNISTLFQELSKMLYFHSKYNNREDVELNDLLRKFLSYYVDETMPLRWFNDELKVTTGIDIFNYDFDKKNGSLVVEHGKIELLILTSEKLNENRDLLSSFIGLNTLPLERANQSNNKWYSSIYKNFLNDYKLKEAELDYFFKHKSIRYFYDDSDLEVFKGRWSN